MTFREKHPLPCRPSADLSRRQPGQMVRVPGPAQGRVPAYTCG